MPPCERQSTCLTNRVSLICFVISRHLSIWPSSRLLSDPAFPCSWRGQLLSAHSHDAFVVFHFNRRSLQRVTHWTIGSFGSFWRGYSNFPKVFIAKDPPHFSQVTVYFLPSCYETRLDYDWYYSSIKLAIGHFNLFIQSHTDRWQLYRWFFFLRDSDWAENSYSFQ